MVPAPVTRQPSGGTRPSHSAEDAWDTTAIRSSVTVMPL
jgi:hypothetical protein